MRRPPTIPATEQIDLEIKYQDFQDLFTNTKEATASSPSGIHIGHYKACAKSDYLSKIMAAFMSIPFKYGKTIERWEQSLHCMLQKDSLPYIHRLRIILQKLWKLSDCTRYSVPRTVRKLPQQ